MAVFIFSLSESVVGWFFRRANGRPIISQRNAKITRNPPIFSQKEWRERFFEMPPAPRHRKRPKLTNSPRHPLTFGQSSSLAVGLSIKAKRFPQSDVWYTRLHFGHFVCSRVPRSMGAAHLWHVPIVSCLLVICQRFVGRTYNLPALREREGRGSAQILFEERVELPSKRREVSTTPATKILTRY